MTTTTTLDVTVRVGSLIQIVTVPVNARFTDLLDQLNLPRDSVIVSQSSGELIENKRAFIVDFSPNLSFLIAATDSDEDEKRRVTVYYENQSERVWVYPRWRVRDLIEQAVREMNLELDEEYILQDEIDGQALDPNQLLRPATRDRDYYLSRVANNTLCAVSIGGLLLIVLIILIIVAIVT